MALRHIRGAAVGVASGGDGLANVAAKARWVAAYLQSLIVADEPGVP
jgi:hypothetical protein